MREASQEFVGFGVARERYPVSSPRGIHVKELHDEKQCGRLPSASDENTVYPTVWSVRTDHLGPVLSPTDVVQSDIPVGISDKPALSVRQLVLEGRVGKSMPVGVVLRWKAGKLA